MLLHEVESALLGEACKGRDTAEMMVRCIVHHWYHLHAGIVTGGELYKVSSYPFHKHLTIHIITVISCANWIVRLAWKSEEEERWTC